VCRVTIILLACLLSTSAQAKIHRDHKAVAEFRRGHPCPSTGQRRGVCPGWIVDHRQALCVGGADTPSNLQWQTVAEAKAKDRWECKPGWEERLKEMEHTTK